MWWDGDSSDWRRGEEDTLRELYDAVPAAEQEDLLDLWRAEQRGDLPPDHILPTVEIRTPDAEDPTDPSFTMNQAVHIFEDVLGAEAVEGEGEPAVIAATQNAPWLPPGSCAQVSAGRGLATPHPSVIVRILLVASDSRFFCRPTERGLDLPTHHLGFGADRMTASDGLRALVREVTGADSAVSECIGWVRNVVPQPDADYPHPTPDAYVPVFLVSHVRPVVAGEWVSVDDAQATLSTRHWWPIVAHHLR